jgi:hypothetical protein
MLSVTAEMTYFSRTNHCESMEQMGCVGYNVGSSALVHQETTIRGRGALIFVPSRM